VKVKKEKVDFQALLRCPGKLVWKRDEWHFITHITYVNGDLDIHMVALQDLYGTCTMDDIRKACGYPDDEKGDLR